MVNQGVLNLLGFVIAATVLIGCDNSARYIDCIDGCAKSAQGLQGIAGSTGGMGEVGPAGQNGATGPIGPQGPQGEQGSDGEVGPTGAQGPQGEPGLDGSPGAPGTACTVTSIPGGVLLGCTDGSLAQVLNGVDGQAGTNGADGTSVQTILLCPAVTGGTFREYLLRIGQDLYGVYYNGTVAGMAKLWPGSWQTSDGRNCHFSIDNAGNVSY